MIDTGLTAAEQALVRRDLTKNFASRVEVAILDQNEKVIGSLTKELDPEVEDGQVDFDYSADITRSAQLRVFDEERTLQLEGASPSVKGLYVDRFIYIERHFLFPSLGRWEPYPWFCGPLKSFSRTGPEVSISALGKQALYLPPVTNWTPRKFRKRRQIDEVIEDILRHMGERRIDFPKGLRKKLHRTLSLPRHAEVWPILNRLAQSLNFDLDFDGRGRAILRRSQRNPVFTLNLFGENAVIRDEPSVDYDWDNIINAVEVLGRKPKKGKKRKHESEAEYRKRKAPPRPRFVAIAPRSSALSPHALSRNGKPRFYSERIENDELRRRAECRKLAERVLSQRMSVTQNITYTALTIPFLEPGDKIRSELEENKFDEHGFIKGSLPLSGAGDMTVGYFRKMRPRKRKRKGRGRKGRRR